jgi:hypothetical protein
MVILHPLLSSPITLSYRFLICLSHFIPPYEVQHINLSSALAASVIAAPASTYTAHERRSAQSSSKWVKHDEPLDSRVIVPVKIALKQRNLGNGHDWLMDVSDPSSENYGQHWTTERIAKTFHLLPRRRQSPQSQHGSQVLASQKTASLFPTQSHGSAWILQLRKPNLFSGPSTRCSSIPNPPSALSQSTSTASLQAFQNILTSSHQPFNISQPPGTSSQRSLLGSQRLLKCKT